LRLSPPAGVKGQTVRRLGHSYLGFGKDRIRVVLDEFSLGQEVFYVNVFSI